MLLIPKIDEILLPEVKELPRNIEKMINEGKFDPGEREIIPENIGYWFDEFKKARKLFEFGWPTAIFSRKISPYNRLDKRFLIAEIYFNGKDHEVTTHFQENNTKKDFKKFKMKGQVSINKLSNLFKFVESKYENILETKKESEELRENFVFDKFINDIVSREEKAIEKRKLLEQADLESIGKNLARRRKVDYTEKVIWRNK